MLTGTFVALVTPFKDGNIDYAALERLLAFHFENGTDGLLICGTTAETPALSLEERKEIFQFVYKNNVKKLPLMAGTGSNNTEKTIELTKIFQDLGADYGLVVTPYYNKPPQNALKAHFLTVADAVDLPLVLYNVPGRTGCNLQAETTLKLSAHPRIIGIKEASGDLNQIAKICLQRPQDFSVMSGDDNLTLPMLALGANGVISVVANVMPAEMSGMVRAIQEQNCALGRKLFSETFPMGEALFWESNPIPVKKALYLMGLIEDEVRLPLVKMTDANTEHLQALLAELHLLP